MAIRTITTIEELMSELESGNHNYYGLRGVNENDIKNASERGYLNCSHNWSDGRMENEILSGTCAIGINDYLSNDEVIARYNRALNGYAPVFGTDTVYLIADANEEEGEDENEVILGHNGYGADVVAIVKL